MNKILSITLFLSLPFLLGVAKPYSGKPVKDKIEHTEVIYKDLTGDGKEEKLVFSYSGPELIHLDVSFCIYQIDPQNQTEKEIFNKGWNTWRIYNDPHWPRYSIDNVRAYITDFFGGFCFDSSKNKLCQTKCLGSLWCTEKQIRNTIRFVGEAKDKKETDKMFQEIFVENDITCFAYEPYPENIQMFVWSPSLRQFISIGGCH